MARSLHGLRSSDGPKVEAGGPESSAESDVSMALGAAFLGTLLLGGVVGVESHWELLLLLALVAGGALVFERLMLQPGRRRSATAERKVE